jgi:hypothetical protein
MSRGLPFRRHPLAPRQISRLILVGQTQRVRYAARSCLMELDRFAVGGYRRLRTGDRCRFDVQSSRPSIWPHQPAVPPHRPAAAAADWPPAAPIAPCDEPNPQHRPTCPEQPSMAWACSLKQAGLGPSSASHAERACKRHCGKSPVITLRVRASKGAKVCSASQHFLDLHVQPWQCQEPAMPAQAANTRLFAYCSGDEKAVSRRAEPTMNGGQPLTTAIHLCYDLSLQFACTAATLFSCNAFTHFMS